MTKKQAKVSKIKAIANHMIKTNLQIIKFISKGQLWKINSYAYSRNELLKMIITQPLPSIPAFQTGGIVVPNDGKNNLIL